LSDGWKKKYIEMFGFFTESFNCFKLATIVQNMISASLLLLLDQLNYGRVFQIVL